MQDAPLYALGVAISPVPIAAVLIILSSRGASTNGVAFAAGWVLGVAIAAVVFAFLVNGLGIRDSGPAWIAAAELTIGVGFLAAAARLWLHRSSAGAPARLDAVDGFTPVRCATLGVVLSAANPKVLALSLGAALSVTRSGADVILTGSAIAVFVGIGAIGVVMPIAVYLAVPAGTAARLVRVRSRLTKHEGIVLAGLAVVIGGVFVRDGVQAFAS